MTFSLFIRWLPLFTILMAGILESLALPFPAWGAFRPDLVLICLFYWSLYRGDRVGAGSAFSGGLMIDVLSAGPLGANAFTKMVLVLFIRGQGRRLRNLDYIYHPPLLALFSFLELELQWGLLAMVGEAAHGPLFIGKPIATLLAAPLVTAGLIFIHRQWLEEV